MIIAEYEVEGPFEISFNILVEDLSIKLHSSNVIPFLGAFGKSSAFHFITKNSLLLYTNYLLWIKSSARLHDQAGNIFDLLITFFYHFAFDQSHWGFLSGRRVFYFAL